MTCPRPLPPANELRARFSYDGATGELRWASGRLCGKLTGQADCRGYRKVFIDGIQFFVHRIVWMMVYGEEPEYIDHIDGDRHNNRIANLRSVSRLENSRNSRVRRDNKYGVTGVRRARNNLRRWQARIKQDGKELYLGSFDTFEEAVTARKRAQARLGYAPLHGSAARPKYRSSRAT